MSTSFPFGSGISDNKRFKCVYKGRTQNDDHISQGQLGHPGDLK
jgi:hypothetical protein